MVERGKAQLRFLRAVGICCLTLLGVMSALCVLMATFNRAILRTPSLGLLQPIVVLFFSPRNYYAPILSIPAKDAMETTRGAERSLRHVYPGKYAVELVLAEDVNSMADLPDFDLNVVLMSDHKAFWTMDASNGSSQLAYTNKGRAILLGTYRVPDNAPLDKQIEARFQLKLHGNSKAIARVPENAPADKQIKGEVHLKLQGDSRAIALGTIHISKISDL